LIALEQSNRDGVACSGSVAELRRSDLFALNSLLDRV
jgi:hypothetical protein